MGLLTQAAAVAPPGHTTLDGEERPVPVVSTKEILDRAFADRYGVAAFNILDDLTIDAVLAAAEEERAPVILQTSVKTVRAYGRDRLITVFRAMARDTTVPVACTSTTARTGT